MPFNLDPKYGLTLREITDGVRIFPTLEEGLQLNKGSLKVSIQTDIPYCHLGQAVEYYEESEDGNLIVFLRLKPDSKNNYCTKIRMQFCSKNNVPIDQSLAINIAENLIETSLNGLRAVG